MDTLQHNSDRTAVSTQHNRTTFVGELRVERMVNHERALIATEGRYARVESLGKVNESTT